MSVTVSAVPFLLIFAVGKGIFEVAKGSISLANSTRKSTQEEIHFSSQMAEQILNKEFETNITNSDVLIKTLQEHGATNIIEEIGSISCDCENFHINFYKKEEPFFYMNVSYNDEIGVNELVDNIDSEYKINAQEVSYNKIKERLEKQNLQIDNEEIYDDNTIVLTVNLE